MQRLEHNYKLYLEEGLQDEIGYNILRKQYCWRTFSDMMLK